MCPNGVEWKTLGEVCEIVRGASPRPIGAYLTTAADGIPWIKIGDVNPNSRFIESTVEKITAEGAAHSRLLHKGDFVLSNSMSFGRPYILKIDGCIHDGWVSISKFDKHLISEYLFYILKSDVVQYHWRQKAGKGSVANLNADIIKATPIPLPPLAIQTRIVEILDHFTNLTANLTAELNLRRKQFEHYREKLLTFGDEWNTDELGNLCIIGDGLHGTPTYSKKTGIFFINGNNLKNGAIIITEETKEISDVVYEKLRIEFDNDTIFMSINGTIGNVAFFNNEKIALGKSVAYFKISNPILIPKYLYYFLQCDYAKEYFENSKTGIVIKNLGLKALRLFRIPIPPLAVQHSIVSILDKFTALIENIEKELTLRQKQYEYYREELLRFGG